MFKRTLFMMLAALILATGTSSMASAKARALIVGIDNYDAVNKLYKARADATAIAAELTTLGFEVQGPLFDATRAQIDSAWKDLLAKTGKDDVVLFYFAGHGVEVNNRNYLIARDAEFDETNLGKLKSASLDLQQMLDDLGNRQHDANSVGVFIIDACRENPFVRNAKDAERANPEAGAIAPVQPPRTLFVMYSAGIGQKAWEGRGETSIYATELIRQLKLPVDKRPSLADMAQSLRTSVYQEVLKLRETQTPAYYDQLVDRHDILGQPKEPRVHELASDSRLEGALASRSLARGDVVIECRTCPELIVIPTGEFEMGSPDTEKGRAANEGPRHTVRLTKKIAMGRFEITNREWNQCVREGGCVGLRNPASHRDREPVTNVSWNDAKSYVAWLNKVTGNPRHRLPTEAEWEYAARAGKATRFSFGDAQGTDAKLICEFANGADRNLHALLWFNPTCSDRVGRKTAQVGSYKPNGFGLFDMHGNAWEWVEDCWHADYTGAPADAATPRQADAGAECPSRVARGGSWRSAPAALRSAVRNTFAPSHYGATIGFRIALDLAE